MASHGWLGLLDHFVNVKETALVNRKEQVNRKITEIRRSLQYVGYCDKAKLFCNWNSWMALTGYAWQGSRFALEELTKKFRQLKTRLIIAKKNHQNFRGSDGIHCI